MAGTGLFWYPQIRHLASRVLWMSYCDVARLKERCDLQLEPSLRCRLASLVAVFRSSEPKRYRFLGTFDSTDSPF